MLVEMFLESLILRNLVNVLFFIFCIHGKHLITLLNNLKGLSMYQYTYLSAGYTYETASLQSDVLLLVVS